MLELSDFKLWIKNSSVVLKIVFYQKILIKTKLFVEIMLYWILKNLKKKGYMKSCILDEIELRWNSFYY